MRHRAHIAFILLAAALFAAPQMSQDLSTLKGAVAARIRGEILHAFLGLNSNESGRGAAAEAPARPAASLLASCDAPRPEPQAAPASQRKGAERATPSQRADSNAQATRMQTAMLTDPSEKSNSGLPPALARVELAGLPKEILAEARLAMLTPPGNGVEPPPAYAFHGAIDPRAKSALSAHEKFTELERHASFLQAGFERGAENAEWIRKVSADAARSAENEQRVRTRVLKVRRPAGKSCGGYTAPCAPVAMPVAVSTPNLTVQVSTVGE